MTTKNLNLQLDIVDDETVQLTLAIHSPKNFHFTDEYDIPVLMEVSKQSNVFPQEVILRGLFLELQRLGEIVSYENELLIKEQVSDFCQDYLTV